jgi:hypothetical protein
MSGSGLKQKDPDPDSTRKAQKNLPLHFVKIINRKAEAKLADILS